MDEYPNLTSSPVTPSQTWIVDNIRSIISNQEEDTSIDESNHSDSNNNTLLSTSLNNALLVPNPDSSINNKETNDRFFLDDERFRNITLRPRSQNDTEKLNWTDVHSSESDIEKKRGFVLNYELANQLNYNMKKSFLNDENEYENNETNQYIDVDQNSYLYDKLYHHHNPDDDLNEQFSFKFLQSHCDLLSINPNLINDDLKLNEFRAPSKYFFEELDFEKKVQNQPSYLSIPKLSISKPSETTFKSTSTSSLSSLYSSDLSYAEDSSHVLYSSLSSSSVNGAGSLYHAALPHLRSLNQNAIVNPANTSTPSNKINSYNNCNYLNNQMKQSYSEYFDNRNQGYSENIENENFKYYKPNSYNYETNDRYSNNKSNSFKKIPKSSTTIFGESKYSNNGNVDFNQRFYNHFSQPQTFGHSISYDNIGAMLNSNISNKLKHVTYRSNENNHMQSKWQNEQQSQKQQTLTNESNSNQNLSNNNNKDQIVLHVKNLDYKISADEWKRILLENFRKHCKEIISVNVITNADKSLLGIVNVGTKDDARLAISCLHHKKIGYKRLNVNIAFSNNNNSPNAKIVALLKSASGDSNEMALTKFIELYEARYNQTITVSELFKLKDLVHIFQSKDLQGRQIKLNCRSNFQSNLENEMQDLLFTPYCSLHSHQQKQEYNSKGLNSQSENINSHTSGASTGWLPNVTVSLRTFKSAVHKLLNDHGGQMPLLSFMDCYRSCISNENTNLVGTSKINKNFSVSENSQNIRFQTSHSYQLIIDYENGLPLEHLITCAQDVQIQYNEGFFKQLQWENDKSKPISLQTKNMMNKKQLHGDQATGNLNKIFNDNLDIISNDIDESTEESQRKINQFSHEVVELFKGVSRCTIPLSKFNNEYHKKYGKQCRVADYGYTKLYDLLESLPHILQILDSEFEKKLTLTHRVQVRRFSNDILKVLKSHTTKQMFADEFPEIYEKHFGKTFDIRDYGVCFLEDMLAELPESIICRKEIEGRTFIQIPKIVQMDEERLCMYRLTFDIIDMLRQKPRFSIQFNKFIPNFHHHFGRQCKLSNYGFTKLIELLEAIPNTVQLLVKDGVQFVQLKKDIMIDLVTQNLVNLVEENIRLKLRIPQLEELYNAKNEKIYYRDFDVDNFMQLFSLLPLDKHFLSVTLATNNNVTYGHYKMRKNEKIENIEWNFHVETINEKELKRICKIMLRKLMDEMDEQILHLIQDLRNKNKNFYFKDLFEILYTKNFEFINMSKSLNKRSEIFIFKCMSDFLQIQESSDDIILGFSDIYYFAKQIRSIYKSSNMLDMSLSELETVYMETYKPQFSAHPLSLSIKDHDGVTNQIHNSLPFKRLGFVDNNLLFTQGLKMLVSIKKFNDKRIFLNKEFWPKNFLEVSQNSLGDSINSPMSPIYNENLTTNNQNNITQSCYSNNNYITPIYSQRLTSSLTSASSFSNTSSSSTNNNTNNISRRSILKTFLNPNQK